MDDEFDDLDALITTSSSPPAYKRARFGAESLDASVSVSEPRLSHTLHTSTLSTSGQDPKISVSKTGSMEKIEILSLDELSTGYRAGTSDPLTRNFGAIVKVFCTHADPNYSLPWQMRRQIGSSSSGFIIQGRRILTNAHSLENYTQVKVCRRGEDKKYIAEVLAIGRDCDLGLLTVRDPDFWKDSTTISLDLIASKEEGWKIPMLQETVAVVGYPIGGNNISISQGVVSRIDMQSYVHSCTELLAIQVDAAINHGNSGGPVFDNHGYVIGIAFQTLKDKFTENIGYIIPIPVIAHFMADVERSPKEYLGFCWFGFDYQKMESKALQQYCKLSGDQSGVLIKKIYPLSHADSILKKGDVLLKFDGSKIANDGTIQFPGMEDLGERISASFLVSQRFVGDEVPCQILRDGQVIDFHLRMEKKDFLVPLESDQRKLNAIELRLPSYFIIGGLVFTSLTEALLRSEYGLDFDVKAPIHLVEKWSTGIKETEDEQVVVLAQILSDEVNSGYESHFNTIVHSYNGAKVRNLKELSAAVEATRTGVMRFELCLDEIVVLDASEAWLAQERICEAYGVPRIKSRDLDSATSTSDNVIATQPTTTVPSAATAAALIAT